ncbi:Histidinol phosphate phosphatase HisJ family [uncultured Paludibacter sp.]|uniref:Histidinol-phosphatase n=1 Tax=uncultured Paludibacter sp. TaxID=497635 RepID=A0A653ADL9_9BACT|nr:Histidinol phosphate phosphatase HisJ family [uncultured Paludibacter sp.]
MNFRTNYHSHNVFCDGRSTMEDFVRFAIAKGLKKYGFSSHSPLPFHTSWNMDLDNLPYYKAEFYRLKEKYKGQIELFIGLEIDYIHGVFGARNNPLYSTDDFDYLIGAVHYLDPLPNGGFFSVDGNFFDFERNLKTIYNGDVKEVAKRYFEIIRAMIETGGFNIVGHLDKISLNGGKCDGFDIRQNWYFQTVADLLQLIKEKGYILEVNTKSYLEKGITYPDVQFFPLINELKIPIIVTSDCHYPDKITAGFEPVYTLLKESGFKELMELSPLTPEGGKWVAKPFDY